MTDFKFPSKQTTYIDFKNNQIDYSYQISDWISRHSKYIKGYGYSIHWAFSTRLWFMFPEDALAFSLVFGHVIESKFVRNIEHD